MTDEDLDALETLAALGAHEAYATLANRRATDLNDRVRLVVHTLAEYPHDAITAHTTNDEIDLLAAEVATRLLEGPVAEPHTEGLDLREIEVALRAMFARLRASIEQRAASGVMPS